MDDGSRSTGNIGDEKEHKAAKVLLKPLCWLNKKTTGFLKRALGANYADVTEDEVLDLVDALAKD